MRAFFSHRGDSLFTGEGEEESSLDGAVVVTSEQVFFFRSVAHLAMQLRTHSKKLKQKMSLCT